MTIKHIHSLFHLPHYTWNKINSFKICFCLKLNGKIRSSWVCGFMSVEEHFIRRYKVPTWGALNGFMLCQNVRKWLLALAAPLGRLHKNLKNLEPVQFGRQRLPRYGVLHLLPSQRTNANKLISPHCSSFVSWSLIWEIWVVSPEYWSLPRLSD